MDIADDGVLEFEPSFFESDPLDILERYSIDVATNNYKTYWLSYSPRLDKWV